MDLPIEQIVIIFSIAITFLSVILNISVTVVGWAVTYYFQKRILEMQTQVENERLTTLSVRKDQLNTLRDWFQEGERLWRLRLHLREHENVQSKEDLDKQLLAWKTQTGKVFNLAVIIDREYPEIGCIGCLFAFVYFLKDQTPPSDLLATRVNEFYNIIADISTSSGDQKTIDQYTGQVNKIFSDAMEKIDKVVTKRLTSTPLIL